MPGKEWAKECFDCWKAGKNAGSTVTAKPKADLKTTAMYVAYAKDLVVAQMQAGNTTPINAQMMVAIDAIKLAIKEFSE